MRLIKTVEFVDPALKLSKAVMQWTTAGFPLADAETLKQREEICAMCEDWDAEARGGLGKCKVCGCTKLKRNMATEKCPKGKW